MGTKEDIVCISQSFGLVMEKKVHEQHWRSLLHTGNPSLLELHKYSPVSCLGGLFLY